MSDVQSEPKPEVKTKKEKAAVRPSAESVPEFARTVLVPIANPETAPDLLHIATALLEPDEGKLIALVVTLGDVESSSKAVEELNQIVEDIRQEGHTIAVEMVKAPTVARGILDAMREFGADLVILGAQQPRRGEVQLGKVVESVMQTADADVLIYRRGLSQEFKRVIVPIDNSFRSQVSARLALRLSSLYDASVEAMHVQGSHHSQYEGLARIEEAIAALPDHRRIKRTVVDALNPVEGILSRLNGDDLVIVGLDKRNDFDKVLFGNITDGLLNRAQGPVIVVSRTVASESAAERYLQRFVSWVRPRLTTVEQDDIIRSAQVNASLNIDYVTLILVSAAIATLGLLLNSAAVIIGAMLVAPLMSPLISLSSGLAIGRVRMAGRATLTLAMGVLMSLIVAIVLGSVMPNDLATPEMLARGRPTLVDAAVALASGIVGAYATARKDIPAALAGVAIAAALMPPICTVGLGLSLGDNSLAFGALILFLTNIFSIILAGMVVFLYLGMNLRRYDDVARPIQIASLAFFFALGVPIALIVANLTQDAVSESRARAEIQRTLAPAELVSVDFRDGDIHRVIATVRSTQTLALDTVLELEERLTEVMGESVQIDLVVLPVVRFDVRPEDAEDEPNVEGLGGMIEGMSELTQDAEKTPEAEATSEATVSP